MSIATDQIEILRNHNKKALAIGAKLKNKGELTEEDIKKFKESYRYIWYYVRENDIAEEIRKESDIIERRFYYLLIEVTIYLILKNTKYQDIFTVLENLLTSINLYNSEMKVFNRYSNKELPDDLPEKLTLVSLGMTDEVIKSIVMSRAENDLIANYPAYLANHNLSADEYERMIDRLVFRITSTPYTVEEWFNTLYASTNHNEEAELMKNDVIKKIKWLKANTPYVLEKNKHKQPILFELE